jgi:hypothetical protein
VDQTAPAGAARCLFDFICRTDAGKATLKTRQMISGNRQNALAHHQDGARELTDEFVKHGSKRTRARPGRAHTGRISRTEFGKRLAQVGTDCHPQAPASGHNRKQPL